MRFGVVPHAGRSAALALLVAWLLASPAMATVFEVTVDDGQGPVPDAVISLQGEPSQATPAPAVMDQRDSEFVPGVLPVQVGTTVSFPNSDVVQHQVYSFSPTKPFELPLYAGVPLAPVTFDRAGVVVVGCNIHDWMIGHIVVLDTPHFAKTDAQGRARIELPAGRYRLQAWHARQTGEAMTRDVVVADGSAAVVLSLVLGPAPASRRGNDRLRALQERFRRLERDP